MRETKYMAKKILLTILVSILLISCISITGDSETPAPGQNFVTATLAPTKTELLPADSIIPSETTTPAMTVPANCTTTAVLLRDATIQDNTQVKAGEKFTKTWEFQNIGTCPWVDYTIKFSAGDEINAPLSAPMPATAPNEKVLVSMELTAPTADGTYAGYFTLQNSDGKIVPIGTEKTFWVKFVVGAAIIPTAPRANPMQAGNCSRSQNANYVSQIMSLINAERAKAGLNALTFDTQIAAFAQSHAEDMAYNNFLSHDGSDGSFGERMMHYNATHPGHEVFGEILAIGTPQNAMDQWRKDEHWNFVLGSQYTLIGAGYAYNSCSDFGGYFTVDFGG
jgi:uncharacterized protein YkwD